MSDIAIRVEGISKRYRIGKSTSPYKTLRESMMQVAGVPVRMARRIFKGLNDDATSTEFWALNDVSFSVKRGEVVGVIGRNGAGKSTLLKVLSRITEPTRGEAVIEGRVGSLLEVGTGFHPELTGRENIFLNGAILGMRKTEIARKLDEIIAFSEIEKFIDTPVKRYSSGMYTRLAFAVAAHLEPEILIVDEVLAVGDAEFQKKCLGKMQDVSSSGRTVVFVSHNMSAVEQLCTTAVMLESGKLKHHSSDVRSIVKEYLFGGHELGSTVWVNPGDKQYDNPAFRAKRFFLANANGAPQGGILSNDADLWFQLECDIQTRDAALSIGIAVYNEDGLLIFWSQHTDMPESAWPKLGIGPCTLRMKIPPRYLNEGVYRVELIASFHKRQWILQPGVSSPAVVFTIQGGLSDSPLWRGKRPGAMAPVLPWERIA